MPRPSRMWPVRFKVVLNPVVPVLSYREDGEEEGDVDIDTIKLKR